MDPKRSKAARSAQAKVRKEVAAAVAKVERRLPKVTVRVPRTRAPTRQGRKAQRRNNPMPRNKVSRKEMAVDPIAASLMLPLNQPTERYADQYGAIPTATANPWSRTDVAWADADAVPNRAMTTINNRLITEYEAAVAATPRGGTPPTRPKLLAPTEVRDVVASNSTAMAFAFRNPFCSTITWDANPDEVMYNYNFYLADNSPSVVAAEVPPALAVTLNTDTVTAIKAVYAKPTQAYQPHGALWFAASTTGHPGGIESDRRFYWLTAGDFVVFHSEVSNNADMGVIVSENGGERLMETINVADLPTPHNWNYAATITGYYAFDLRPHAAGNATLGGFTMKTTSTAPVWCHRCVPGLETNFTSAELMRMPAVALMYTNTAPAASRGGRIAAGQLPDNRNWVDIAADGYSKLSSFAGITNLDAIEGAYTFLKPTQTSDFDYKEWVDIDDGILWDSFWPIGKTGAFLAICAEVESLAGREGQWTFSCGIEYQTTDVWRTQMPALASPSAYNTALVALRDMQNVYANPIHVAEIIRGLRKAVRTAATGISRYGHLALPIVGAIGGPAATIFANGMLATARAIAGPS